jgi:hypothetical protein
VRYTEPNLKIAGGQIANENSWPSMVYIQYRSNLNGEGSYLSYCGGSLIKRNVVLTAAQCIFKKYYFGYFSIDVLPNPTYEAMLTVYLGVKNVVDGTVVASKTLNVSKVILVSILLIEKPLYSLHGGCANKIIHTMLFLRVTKPVKKL